jgi:hypothetical protein
LSDWFEDHRSTTHAEATKPRGHETMKRAETEFGVNTKVSKNSNINLPLQRGDAVVGLRAHEADIYAAEIEAQVDGLFRDQQQYDSCVAENPTTGVWYVPGVDSVELQKEVARRALAAQRRFARIKPADTSDLPIHRAERARMKTIGGESWIVAEYAASLELKGYDADRHPNFTAYAAGIMASPLAPEFIRQNEELLRQFPPRALAGLGPGMVWNSP